MFKYIDIDPFLCYIRLSTHQLMSFSVDHNRLQKFYDVSNVPEFCTLARAHILHKPGVRLNCQIDGATKSKKDIYLQSNHEIIGQVGSFYAGNVGEKIKLKTPENKPRLISLNIGSFGLNSLNNEKGTTYNTNLQKFVNYVKSAVSSSLILSLQDVPNDSELFDGLNQAGFDIYFFPNLFYSLGQFKSRPDCGQAILINKNIEKYDLNILNISLSFHHGGFPDYHKSFKKYQSQDLLHKPTTLYFTIQNKITSEFYLISNAYVSAFSSSDNRFESIKDSVELVQQMIDQLSRFKNEQELIVRFTGDFNIYGYDTHQGPFGMKAEPWAHLPAVISALIYGFRPLDIFKGKLFTIGKNQANLNEFKKVQAWLKSKSYVISTDSYNEIKKSKTVMVEEFAPSFTKRIFKGAGASWILDMCIYPIWSRKFNIWYEKEPFGDIDHETLIVQL